MRLTGLVWIAAVLLVPPALRAGEAEPEGKGAAVREVSSSTAPVSPGSLEPGYRAVSIPAAGDQLLYVKKGDRVDVLVSYVAPSEKGGKELTTATILQNVVVTNIIKPAKVEDQGVIEFLMDPVEAQYVALSVARGKKVEIAVRAPGDHDVHPMDMASFRKLIR